MGQAVHTRLAQEAHPLAPCGQHSLASVLETCQAAHHFANRRSGVSDRIADALDGFLLLPLRNAKGGRDELCQSLPRQPCLLAHETDALAAEGLWERRSMEKPNSCFPTELGSPATGRDSHFPHSPDCWSVSSQTSHRRLHSIELDGFITIVFAGFIIAVFGGRNRCIQQH